MALLDDFNRSNSTGLGASWTDVTNGFNVASNQASSRAGGDNQSVYIGAGAPATNDQRASIVTGDASGNERGPIARSSDSSETFYWVDIIAYGSSQTHILYQGPSFSSLGSWSQQIGTGVEIAIEVESTAIRVYVAGVQKLSVTNSGIASGKIGLFASGSALPMDDFSGNDLGGGTDGTATATGQKQPARNGTVTGSGDGTATVTGIGLYGRNGTATESGGASATITGQNSPARNGTAIGSGGANATANGNQAPAENGTVTVSGGASASPGGCQANAGNGNASGSGAANCSAAGVFEPARNGTVTADGSSPDGTATAVGLRLPGGDGAVTASGSAAITVIGCGQPARAGSVSANGTVVIESFRAIVLPTSSEAVDLRTFTRAIDNRTFTEAVNGRDDTVALL